MPSRANARPTLRQIEYLLALAESLSFRRAAEACHVSQPALSEQIKDLEQRLGVVLFERGRRVLLTDAGRVVVERARAVMDEVDGLVDAALGQGGPLSGPLRLGVIPTVGPYLLPRVLPGLHAAHPELALRVREAQTSVLVEALRAGKLDAALLALPVPDDALDAIALLEDRFLLALPPGHPLARRKAVGEADLDGAELLLLDDGHCFRDQALALCRRAGAHELGDFRAASLATLSELVKAGHGITLLPEMAAQVEGVARGLVVRALGRGAAGRPAADGGPARTIGLAFRKGTARAADMALLAQVLREGATGAPAGAGAQGTGRRPSTAAAVQLPAR